MIAKYAMTNSLLFDGNESEIIDRYFVPDTEIATGVAIKFNDFARNAFEDLRAIIGDADFETIIQTGGFTTDNGFLKLYKGSEGLRLYFCKKGNTIMVFAYGEFQPTRYKLYLEGVWKIN
ncbi:hypothetical protein [Mucilaginibacter aquaedulcis]|uniref:hypothetical protein n=1 Tax=Mucilaginibacter aquaedulcis TaxID=1187081 RepID=UPI0025B2BCB1|nr:hypothetical protein [Mucilaginibacter aquaedulcis]MDN3547482.1 hypothetical protein [Mucilaginibacter aquaedulcis]